MPVLTLSSPSKLNLYLRVLGRRSDGYHELYTLFHRISLSDTLRLTSRPKGFSLRTNVKSLPVDGRNLITRAYNLLKERYPKLGGVSVRLTKRIPMKAGLAGGSSNAAAFLTGMNRLYKLRMTRSQLMSLGRCLGADVPFFLAGANQAIGTGRGDKLRPRPCKQKCWFVLLLSSKGVKTPDVFKSWKKRGRAVTLTKVSREVTLLCAILDRKNSADSAGLLLNDLEQSACQLRPFIKGRITKLSDLGIGPVRMSGSGPSIFTLLPSETDARQYADKVRRMWPHARVEIASTV